MSMSEADVKAAFEALDTDGSGFIEADEFDAVMVSLGEPMTSSEIKAALAAIDNNSDGKLSFEEFYAWFSDDSRSKNNKSFLLLNLLKAKVAMKKGRAWFKTKQEEMKKFAAKAPQADAFIKINIGEDFETPEFGIQMNYSKGETLPEKWKTLNGVTGTFDVECTGQPGWEDFVAEVGEALEFGASGFVKKCEERGKGCAGVSMAVLDSKENTVRVTAAMKERDNNPPPQEVVQIVEMFASNSLRLEIGANAVDLITKKMETLCLKDVMKAKITFNGELPPMAAMMMPMLPGMMEAVGLEASDIPGLQGLLDGESQVTINLNAEAISNLLNNKIKPMLQAMGAPFPIPDDLFTTPFVSLIPGGSYDMVFAEIKGEPRLALGAAAMAVTTVVRRFKAIKGFSCHLPGSEGPIGCSVEFAGFDINNALNYLKWIMDKVKATDKAAA